MENIKNPTESQKEKVRTFMYEAQKKQAKVVDVINESPNNKIAKEEGEELEKEITSPEISPEKIEGFEALLQNVEKERAQRLENGPLSSRLKNGVINGLEKWENFGKGEKGVKGFAKRFSKMTVNLALIGAISSVSVDQLAKAGIGTATALSGGATSYLARKMIVGLGMGGIMEA